MSVIEKWRLIEGYEYEVSDQGNVRRVGSRSLKPRVHSNGYHRVSLRGETNTDAYVHRLVCAAFLGAATDGAHADHINGDRRDNRLVNLRWLSPEANRAARNFARGARSNKSALTESDIRAIRSAPHSRWFDGRMAKILGVSRETVRDIRNHKAWSHVDACD